MKTTSALLMALAITIAGACEKKAEKSPAEPEKAPAVKPEKTGAPERQAPAAAPKPDAPAPPPMIGTISAPELSAWAKTVTPGSKRVGRSKLPRPEEGRSQSDAVAALREEVASLRQLTGELRDRLDALESD